MKPILAAVVALAMLVGGVANAHPYRHHHHWGHWRHHHHWVHRGHHHWR